MDSEPNSSASSLAACPGTPRRNAGAARGGDVGPVGGRRGISGRAWSRRGDARAARRARRTVRPGLRNQQPSSRLLHGGLRYLAKAAWARLRGKPREVHPAPHRTPFGRAVAVRVSHLPRHALPLWQLRIGVKLYDFLCRGRNLGASRAMTAAEVRAHVPGIRSTGLTGGVRYFDALTNDARLVIDTLRSAPTTAPRWPTTRDL